MPAPKRKTQIQNPETELTGDGKPASPVFVPAKKVIWPMFGYTDSSLIPILRVIGDVARGKSTFIANILAQPRLQADGTPNEAETLILDTEESYPTLKAQYALDVVNIFSLMGNLPESADKLPEDHKLFLAYLRFFDGGHGYDDYLAKMQAGKYRVIAVDSTTKLFNGAMMYLKANPQAMAIYGMGYGGEIGQKTAWSDASRWWGNEAQRLKTFAQDTVAFAFHRKLNYKKQVMELRGADFTDRVTLSITIFDDRDTAAASAAKIPPQRFGIIDKQRMDATIFYDGDGNLLEEPIMAKVLPTVLIPNKGQSFPAAIREYMKKPLPDYGSLDIVDADKLAVEIEPEPEEVQNLIMQDLGQAKKDVARRLTTEIDYNGQKVKLFANNDDVKMVMIDQGWTTIANAINTIDEFEAKMREYGFNRLKEKDQAATETEE